MAGVVNIGLSGIPGEGHGFDHISDSLSNLLSSYRTVRMLLVGSP